MQIHIDTMVLASLPQESGMSEPAEKAIESTIPLFDVMINVPPGARLAEIERLARDVAGIAPDRIERLMQVLQGSPQAKIGSGVTREKAD
ncbi:MAG: hypothetical protein M3Q12_00775, partial [Pseudomonadota bacterium]|nr:hypothetical protein [Pseudomonadota bacterium]